ncbi:SusD/RagB family nutrient-binding outer membrane lipoprotein [Sphingobacterium rhinopitheci]|uniref:SusD/RagB family nutrient-binding outer membrane lipoprotein n=1 Tax=Sphingobacterium rhinopitheci TaxID=2781960 RepID=UPI001F515F6A|nr:SusD/RagB family nutrient-binding outer membrane lipoprotein [Sphingobacterium rhinopitheci]MCI0920806.1 SusD/RagB family nutrient-binding outer membrane lipoprotein [Sphingobacterium rhinopitheci]
MKNIFSKIALALAVSTSLYSCSKFDEINTPPTAANEDQVQIEYFFNNSLIGAQQDPHVAERAFIIYWKTVGRQHFTTGLAGGTANDGYSSDYWSYASSWLNHVNTGIQIANNQIEKGNGKEYTSNMIQISRIWRAYLMSELSDNFGPIPIDAFTGENPKANSVKEVYYFLFEELKDATSKINTSVAIPSNLSKFDAAYGFNYDKWISYANSMRLRLAMRLSEVDPAKAKAEFEEAVATNKLLLTQEQIFQVAEKPGWDALTGVMSRPWNGQILSTTLNNLYHNLGGIKSEDQLSTDFHSAIKDEDYAGKRMLGHYSSLNNDPSAGYFFDGLPYAIDPRAYKTFFIPGNVTSPIYPSSYSQTLSTVMNFLPAEGFNTDTLKLDTKNTWSTLNIGDNGEKGTRNGIRSTQVGQIPGLSESFRSSTNKRVFFANWETYFLLAEASLKGWNTGTTAQAAYENGIKANFTYWGVSEFATDYLASESYNRVGTSVKFTHISEPGASHTVKYVDGYTGTTGTTSMPYPVNNIYQNGSVRNDALTKIITQKYIANMPWLPLESWNDQRRLGLPFFENPSVENPLPNLPNLTTSNYTISSIKNFPQRLPYPSTFREADGEEYNNAVTLLGGADNVLTPLWWAKQN